MGGLQSWSLLKEPVNYAGIGTLGMNFIICSIAHTSKHNLRKTIPSVYWKNPNVLKFHDLMNAEDV